MTGLLKIVNGLTDLLYDSSVLADPPPKKRYGPLPVVIYQNEWLIHTGLDRRARTAISLIGRQLLAY